MSAALLVSPRRGISVTPQETSNEEFKSLVGKDAVGAPDWVSDFEDGSLITGRTMTLNVALSDTTTATATTTVSSTATFLGLIVQDPNVTITSATLAPPGSTNWTNAAGQVIVGAAVPEPQALAAAIVGLAAAWVGVRRRFRRGAAQGIG
jgi:hypothetical protein